MGLEEQLGGPGLERDVTDLARRLKAAGTLWLVALEAAAAGGCRAVGEQAA
jgi:hypothetical protein